MAAGVACTLALAGCGRGREAPAAAQATGPDLDRPCTVLTPSLAEATSEQPFYRTLVADYVEGDAVSCAQSVGKGGIQAVARLIVYLPREAGPAEVRFAALCRGETASRLSEPQSIVTVVTPGPSRPPQSLGPGMCRSGRGGIVVRLRERVAELAVEEGDGTINEPATTRLAREVQARAGQNAEALLFSQSG